MHWAVIPLLVTAVSAAAVDTELETDAKRDGKRKKYHKINVNLLLFIQVYFSVQHLSNCQIQQRSLYCH